MNQLRTELEHTLDCMILACSPGRDAPLAAVGLIIKERLKQQKVVCHE